MRYQYIPTRKTQRKYTFSEHVINSELSYSVDGNEKQCMHLGKSLAVQHKVKHELIIKPNNLTPSIYQKNENMPT